MTERWVSPVGHDRTRPVVIFHEWKLTGNDRTPVLEHPVTSSSASSHNLSALMTVEIERSVFEVGATWRASRDRMLGSCVRSIRSVSPVTLIFSGLRSQRLCFVGASI